MKASDEWFVYLLRCSDASLYTGIAKDVAARLSAHNAGKGAAYTRSRLPVKLLWRQGGHTRSSALAEEARIKSLERPDKLEFLKKARAAARAAVAAAALLLAAAAPALAVPTFTKENAVIRSSASVQAFTGETTYAPLRMYYILSQSSGAPHTSSGPVVLSATSVDGLAFTDEAGVRLGTATIAGVSASSITGFSLLPLGAGGFRALYSIVSTTGAFRIHVATSADGLSFGGNSVAVDGVAAFVGSPRLVKLDSGDWRLYYVRDSVGAGLLSDRRIYTARSTDEGATWGASSVAVSTTAHEVGAHKRGDGRVRLLYTQPTAGTSSATLILSQLSSDALGTSFTQETGVRISTPAATGALSSPVVVMTTDTFRWRLYYGFHLVNTSTGDARSALTGLPDPTSIAPGSALQNAAGAQHAITGEIFSGGAGQAVSLVLGATTINGTGVTRVNDRTITATFDTQNKPLGLYDLVVTNNDGVSKTLASSFLIDFAPGSILATNNLLRPRGGAATTFDVTLFAPGYATVRVHDLGGRPLRTLFEGNAAAGSFTVTWDGRDASGTMMPSGVYLVVSSGPKLNAKTKVVLIR